MLAMGTAHMVGAVAHRLRLPGHVVAPVAAAVLLLHLAIELLLASGRMTMEVAVCKPSVMATYALTHGVFVLMSQYVHLWGRAPDWVCRALVVAEAALHSRHMSSCQGLMKGYGAAVAAQVLGTLAMPCVWFCAWRQLLMRPRVLAGGGGAALGVVAEKQKQKLC